MVLQQNNKKSKYTIEYKVYKDVAWYRGWFRGLVPQWSEWKVFDSFSSLKVINIIINDLEVKNKKVNHKIEYRVIRNTNERSDKQESSIKQTSLCL